MTWTITQKNYDPKEEAYFETLFSLSNGLVGVRNTLDFESSESKPGTFFSGLYGNALATKNEIVNAPSWLDFDFIINNQRVQISNSEVISFNRTLDIKKGSVKTHWRCQDAEGKIMEFVKVDIVNLRNKNVAHSYGYFRPINFSGKINFRTFFNYSTGNSYLGGLINDNIKTQHLDVNKIKFHTTGAIFYTEFPLKYQEKKINMAHKFIVDSHHKRTTIYEKGKVGEQIELEVHKGVKYNYKKNVCFEIKENNNEIISNECLNTLNKYFEKSINNYIDNHISNWQDLWNKCDIEITGDSLAQEGVRFSLFHLLQSANSSLFGENIASRGLTSEYHQGHFFFNSEVYLVPLFTYILPEKAKSLLYFRYKTLDVARELAKKNNNCGAYFPEQTDYNGYPGGPYIFDDLKQNIQLKELTGSQVKFINALCVYAFDKLNAAIQNSDFILQYGSPIMVESARFYSDLLIYNDELNLYETHNIMGPDEYHISINNNFFFNYLIKYTLRTTLKYLEKLEQDPQYETIISKLNISSKETEKWKEQIQKIYNPLKKSKIIEQFDNYFNLADKKIIEYDNNNRPVIPPDIKEISDNFMNNNTQIIKQSDVIMLLSLFRNSFHKEIKVANFQYYEPRTVHESSLSTSHAAQIAFDIGNYKTSYNYFLNSVRFNLDFQPKTNYKNGIHLAGNAGGLLTLFDSFLGIVPEGKYLKISPLLPKSWQNIKVNINWRGNLIEIQVSSDTITVQPKSILNLESTLLKYNDNIYDFKEKIVVPRTFTNNFKRGFEIE